MRKQQKQKAEELVRQMEEAHDQLKKYIEQGSILSAMELLEECQNSGITLGTLIENTEGEAHPTVSLLEEYCELAYQIHEQLTEKKEMNTNKTYKLLRQKLIKVSNSLKNDVRIRIEVAFFPYKASMWDSLESVYLAAKEDSDCDAYCVPIPYYDMNSDRSFGQMHYEGGEYPDGIEITDWQEYDFEERKPDVIYIHNPYDNCNLVTSVHPRYYSSNLKKYTDTLVYIPYYVTSGGMLAGQSMLPSYLNVDYIVIQSPQFREQFDKNIPDEKFLPFGSPKVDRVINKCKNPAVPPKAWTKKMTDQEGRRKRIIFYNTGISAMLKDTENFLKKMEYVFKCFMGREDVCLLWRPHPLLESSFDSMRPAFRPAYDALKKTFIEKNLGIYDTTPDIEESIALSDAYIGDAGTSVISLFGVAGKPIFILNDRILEEPGEDDWRKDILLYFDYTERDRFNIIQGNKLYVSEPFRYDYKYFCDLAEDEYRKQYSAVHEINGKWYACPLNAQDILVIGEKGVEKSIALEKIGDKRMEFFDARKYDKYLLLLPMNYPAIVRCDTETEVIRYFTDNIDVLIKEKKGQKIIGGYIVYQEKLYIASPTDNMMYKLDIQSGRSCIVYLPIQSRCGCHGLFEYKGDIWITPYDGCVIVRWNPETNEVREYEGVPDDFLCINPADNSECTEKPFCIPAFHGEYVYLLSCWANMSLRLNVSTGEFTQWIPEYRSRENNTGTLKSIEKGMFLHHKLEETESDFRIYSSVGQKLYSVNLGENVFQETKIRFDLDELRNNEPGFGKCSDSLPFACIENHFNTLYRFLVGKTLGNQFIREKQFAAYRKIIVNYEDGCGKKIQEIVKRTKMIK